MTRNKAIEHWDDERQIGNGIIVTLYFGWSFEPGEHQGVRGFDTVREAREATRLKALYRCRCQQCTRHSDR
ncbi:MAG TPA: hypothetical protein VFA48_06510 [Gammaproteobacteria bacterium]|nr:hypothetical protein [Gammaproteobacteria bacterium]